jgi:competence protein ComER
MSIGVIGLGRLGSALVRGLFGDKGDESVYGFNRSPGKGSALKRECPGLLVCNSAAEVIELCDVIFVWTKPDDAMSIMEDNAALIAARHPLLVSCALNVPMSHHSGRWAECYPNINMAVGKGVTVIHYAPSLPESDRTRLRDILSRVGTVYESTAEDMPYYSALCSCGPALYAMMTELLADVLCSRRGFDRALCRRMVRETVLGTALLQEADASDAAEVAHRVAHPGGSTDAGLRHLKTVLPGIYEQMLKDMKKW